MLNTPNLLSLLRILLVPLLVVVLLTKFDNKEVIALAVFWLAALTDFLDGYIARRQALITRFGKLLDPAADKILTSAAFISLVELGAAPAWMVVAIIAREFAVSTLRGFAAAEGTVIAAGLSGKIKTVVQVIAISLLILSGRFVELTVPARWALWLALLVTVYSGLEYFIRFGSLIFRDRTPPRPS